MKFRVETETGSIYIIDLAAKTWRNDRKPAYQGYAPLRTRNGEFTQINEIEIGKPIKMIGKAIDDTMDFRLIETSFVIKIIELPAD